MKIGFIYESGFANNNGSNHLLCSVIRKMLDDGNEVHLIESVGLKENDIYPDCLKDKNFYCHAINIKYVKKNKFVKRYLTGISLSKKIYKEAKKIGCDYFFIQSSPTIYFTIKKIAKIKKPIIYNIHDIFPGSAYQLGILKIKLLDILFRLMQRQIYKKCNLIIAMSNDMKNKLLEEKVDNKKIKVVNSWYDDKNIRYIDNNKNNFIKENNIDLDKLIVQFAGNVGQVFDIKSFSKIVNDLKNENNIEFHIIGNGIQLPILKENTKNCSNIKYFDWQPSERLSEIYSYCSLEIIPLNIGVIGNDVPSKIALALACGKPILNIVEKSNYFEMFKENGIGFSYVNDDYKGIENKLIELSNNKNDLLNFFNVARDFSNEYFSKEKNLNKLMNYIKKYIKESKGDK